MTASDARTLSPPSCFNVHSKAQIHAGLKIILISALLVQSLTKECERIHSTCDAECDCETALKAAK